MTKEQAENAEKRFHTINFNEIELFRRLAFQSNESNNRFMFEDFSKVYVAVTYQAKPFFNLSTRSPFFFSTVFVEFCVRR